MISHRDSGATRVPELGVVVIGRNEGERLARCLASIPIEGSRIVYVDSGSTDGSVAMAQGRGVDVVRLDLSTPFTAARARNTGWRRLLDLAPDIAAIQFIDGDCEVVPGFVEEAAAVLTGAPDVVAVCGWRRERQPERSGYNTVCDVEWRSGPVGNARSFGGDVLVSAAALRAVGGYDDTVIAAEDDELCVRLRRNGGRIVRIDRTSTMHDADMTDFRQWWRRATRCGHGYAQVSDMHGAAPDHYFVREVRRAYLWGLAVPAVAAGLALPSFGLSLCLFGFYPLQAVKVFRGARQKGFTARESGYWAASCTVAKVPEAIGMLTYRLNKLRRRSSKIIEYKGPGRTRVPGSTSDPDPDPTGTP